MYDKDIQRKYKYYIVFISLLLAGSFYLFEKVCYSTQYISLPEDTSNAQDLVFMSNWGTYDSKAPMLKESIKQISTHHSELNVEDWSMSGSEFLFNLKTDFANGNEPDIFGLWPGSEIQLLIKKGKVADLTEVLKKDKEWYSRFDKDAWKYVTVDNRIYGLPIEIVYEGLFINKDLFDKFNVKIPRTYEELITAIKVFKDNDIIPIAYNDTSEGSYIYQNMVMKIGGKEAVEHPFDEDGNIKKCFIEAMYYMKELYHLGAFPETWSFMNDKERNDLFLNKKAAMIVQGSWFVGQNALNSNATTVDIIPFPSMPNSKIDYNSIIYGGGNGIFYISQKAWENRALRLKCIKFLKSFTSPDIVYNFYKDTNFISNVCLDTNNVKKSRMKTQGEALIQSATQKIGAVDWYIDRNIWENIIIKYFPDVLRGKLSPEEVFSKVSKSNSKMEGLIGDTAN